MREGIMGRRVLILVYVTVGMTLGCIDYGIDGAEDDTPADDDTTEQGDDDVVDDDVDDDHSDDDSAEPSDGCADEVWPDLEVEVSEDCCEDPGEALWDMQVMLSFEGETNCGPVHVGHMLDANGDGLVNTYDPMQVWSHRSMNVRAELITHDGVLSAYILDDARTISASIGDVDPSLPGMEFVAGFDPEWTSDYNKLAMWDAAGNGPLWMIDIPEASHSRPWLTDLEGDGTVEVLSGAYVVDGITGTVLATLDGMPPDDTGPPVAADLDLDGTQEIIATSEYDNQVTGLFAPDGSLLHTCWTAAVNWSHTAYAIGNFDDDPEGEFLAAGNHMIQVFDTDCTVMYSAAFHLYQPSVLGIGELDGDPYPEVVMSSSGDGLIALDHDLTEKWNWQHGGVNENHSPFALADLDADGLHEILIRPSPELVVLDGAGAEVLTFTAPDCNCSSWIGAPSVVDIDADGLAEIVMPAWPTMAIVENDFGGWPLDGSDEPWTWVEKFPGSRTPDGQVPTPTTRPWQDPHTNVWQALPVGSSAVVPHPDLVLGDIDVCTEEDSNRALVTAYLANQGPLTIYEDVANFAYRPTDGTFLDDSVLQPPLLSGQSRPIQFSIHVDDLADGLEIRADVLEDISECEEGNNSATWSP